MKLEIEEHIDLENAMDFFDYFLPWKNNLSGYIFRGHSSSEYKLIPNALRKESHDKLWLMSGVFNYKGITDTSTHQFLAEYIVLSNFYTCADMNGLSVPKSDSLRKNIEIDIKKNIYASDDFDGVWLSEDVIETATLAQHYGVPTRLLDWSHDPFVAAYFALVSAIGQSGRLHLWCLNKSFLNAHSFFEGDININFITPHYSKNPNINAQKGIFTHCPTECFKGSLFVALNNEDMSSPIDRRPLNDILSESMTHSFPVNKYSSFLPVFKRVSLPCSEALVAFHMLQKFGYTSARLFPGYGGVARTVRDAGLSQ